MVGVSTILYYIILYHSMSSNEIIGKLELGQAL